MLIAARNKAYIQKLKAQLKKEFDMNDLRETKIFKAQLKKEFDMNDLRETKKILSMEITRDRDSDRLWLS